MIIAEIKSLTDQNEAIRKAKEELDVKMQAVQKEKEENAYMYG